MTDLPALRQIAEQLRIMNLLIAAQPPLSSSEALTALRVNQGSGDAPKWRLRPDIAAALLEEVDPVVDAEIHCPNCDCEANRG